MQSDLFNVAMSHCDSIKDDLEAQDEKLESVKNKVEDLSKNISQSKRIMEECRKQCYKHRWVYLVLALIVASVVLLRKN